MDAVAENLSGWTERHAKGEPHHGLTLVLGSRIRAAGQPGSNLAESGLQGTHRASPGAGAECPLHLHQLVVRQHETSRGKERDGEEGKEEKQGNYQENRNHNRPGKSTKSSPRAVAVKGFISCCTGAAGPQGH